MLLEKNYRFAWVLTLLKNGAILYNEAEVTSLSIRNPRGWPMLPFDCHKILESDGCNCLFYFTKKLDFFNFDFIILFPHLRKKAYKSCEFELLNQIYKCSVSEFF